MSEAARQTPLVQQRYLLRIANVALIRSLDALPRTLRGAESATDDFAEHCSVIHRLLDSAPFVESVVPPTHTKGIAVSVKTPTGQGITPRLGQDSFFLRCSFPREAQDLPPDYRGNVVEDVVIVYDGLTFCMFAPYADKWDDRSNYIGLHRYDWLFVDEVRDALVSALSADPRYTPVVIDPEDLDLWLDARVVSSDEDNAALELWIDDSNMAVSIDLPASHDPDEALLRLAMQAMRGSSDFYEVMQLRVRRDTIVEEMRDGIRRLSELYAQLVAIPWWQFWRWSRISIVREMRLTIGSASMLHVEAVDVDLALSENIKYCEGRLANDDVLSREISYFREHMRQAMPDLSPTLRVLGFYEEETRSTVTSGSAAVTTIIAAVVGAAVAIAVRLL